MVHVRVLAAVVALAGAILPRSTVAQRATDYAPFRAPYGAGELRRLELVRTIPIRVSWSRRDLALASAFTAALLVDAAQTRRLARAGWRDFEETNPLLGPRPSVGRVNTYTAVAGLTVLGVSAVAPKRARPWVLGVALAVEAYALAAMSRNGVVIRVP